MPGRPPRWREIAGKAARVFEELGCTVELVEKVFDDPIELWMAEFYAGVGTRLKKPLAEQRDLIDPAVAAVLETALDQTIDALLCARVRPLRVPREGAGVLRALRSADDADHADAGVRLGRDVPIELDGESIVGWVAYTYPVNLCGLPAASVPCGFTRDGLPVGLHIVVEDAARDRHPARRRGVRGGAAVGGPQAARIDATGIRDESAARARWRLR